MSLEAMKMALEEMEYARANRVPNMGAAIEALRQAIEQAEKQEPAAWMTEESRWRLRAGGNNKNAVPVHGKRSHASKIPLYAAPPKREWVGLTDEEVESWRGSYDFFDSSLARKVEAKLKEKNGV